MTEDTIVEVAPVRGNAVWRLYYVNPCLNCAKRHYHGGGDGPAPLLGSRAAHCTSKHRPWRPDCERVTNVANQRECGIQHVSDGVDLVLASPEVIADFAERYRTNKVVVGRQDRRGAVAYLQSLS